MTTIGVSNLHQLDAPNPNRNRTDMEIRMQVIHRLGTALLTLATLVAGTSDVVAESEVAKLASPDSSLARIVQGEFDSKADQHSFQQALAKAFGNEVKIGNPGDNPANGDGAASDLFGYSVALSGDTALIGAPYDDVGGNFDQGSAYVFMRIAGVWHLQTKLTASDGAAADYFGYYSVALSGDSALIGAPYDDIGPNSQQGSAYVFTRSDGVWSQQSKLTASDGAAEDYFGFSTALSGDTALVGGIYDDNGVNTDQGSAYVFTRSAGVWSQQTKLTASDGALNDRFGLSVSLSNDSALVGSDRDDIGANGNQGSAYVFTRSGTVWSQQSKLTAGDGTAGDQFGYSVALSGDTALVGAYLDDIGANTDRGSAYVFTRSGMVWSQQSKLTAGDGAADDQFGYSVALSGDTALVGAYRDNVGANGDQGSAYVFTRSSAVWSQQSKLTAGDGATDDQFGYSVALSGDTALAGALADDIGAYGDQGSAYVFTRAGLLWSQQAKLTAGEGAAGDQFGWSVALSGDTALIGVYADDIGLIADQGSAYVFTRNGSLWSQQAKLVASDGAATDWFGYSVALSGNTALVGAVWDDNGANVNQGSAYVFTRSGASWSEQAKLVASDGLANDEFGFSVGLDGNSALVGAITDDVGANPDQGSGYVFTRSGTAWSQQSKLTLADGATNDRFGYSVAISGDTALFGAYQDDISANFDQGSATAFTRSGTVWSQQAKLTASDGASGDQFGRAVALFDNTALVGAYADDVGVNGDQGSAYVYTRSGTVWSQQSKLTAGDGAANDRFGISVALSDDVALVGAYLDDIGANANQGSSYAFTRSGMVWSQQGKLTAGDGATNDGFGYSVSLSGDSAMVGAFLGDSTGPFGNPDVGSVYLYEDRYEVTPSAGTNGSLSPSTPQHILSGQTTSFTVTPNLGYSVQSVSGCGGTWSGSSPYFTGPVNADCTVTASFVINQYTVSLDSQGGSAVASITQDFASTVTVPSGPSRTGYTFANWNTAADGNGTSYSPGATFAMPANNQTLFAIWTINQYTVSFDSQGGSAVASITQDFASTVTVPSAPTRTGYTFSNWNTASDGNGTSYSPGATFAMPANNQILFAIWTINQYTVSFDSQGGGAVAPITQDFASTVTVPSAPTRTGYTFANWNTASDGNGTSYAPAATFAMPANNQTLFAIWTINQYTVSFDSQGGSAVASITQDFASTVTVPSAPTRAGYTFANWNTADDGNGTSYLPGATFAMPANNQTLFAIWTINQYTVSFDSQGGSAVASITQDFASTVTVPSAPTRTGFTFANWNAAADGSGTSYAPGATFAMPASNQTLFAIWTINQYTVSFDSQGGSAVASITQDFASTVTVPSGPSRTGYTFANWNTAADGNGTSYSPGATFAMPANNQTLFAIWTINQYTVSFDSQGGSAVASITQDFASTVTVPSAPTRTGYTFANWNTASDGNGTSYAPGATFAMPANNQTLFAILTINQYTVSFDSQGGSAVASITQDFASTVTVPSAPTRTGYTFANWNTAADGNGTSYAPAATFAMPANNQTLFAIWTINQYTVSFDSQGGSAVASITQDFASTVTVPSASTRTGYTFASWNTAADGNGTSYAPGATFAMPANNQTLFAIWTINQYTVSFDSQGGSAVAPITQDFASTVTIPSAPTRTGYTFSNWNTATDGNGTSYAPAATFAMPANNQTLFAIWTINTYTLTYNAGANGSVSGVSPQLVNFGGDGSAVTAVADSGYHFVDWSDGSTANPRVDTNIAANLSVSANFGNDAPTIAIVNDVSVLEDSGAQTLLVTVADLETSAAALTLVASSAQPGLIAHPVVSSTAVPGERSLAFTATPNQNGGPVTITMTVTDSLGVSSQRSFDITVTPVNDAPSFTLASIATHAAASNGVQSVNGFATVDLGPNDEDATQAVADFLIDSVTDADAILVPGSVDIANNGTLSYTLTGVGGSATISVRVRDDGGTGNAGQDTSSAQQFMINVTPGADLQVAKDNNRVSLRDGEVTVYAIVVANAGPNAVTGATLTDNLPGTLVNGSWACIQSLSTATCPQPDANTGNLGVNINLGVNQFLRFDVMATVSGNVGAFVNNTVTTVPPNGTTALNTANDSATDQDPIVPIGIFVDGFEASSRQPLTVSGAAAVMAD